jgi:hypothetical protein
LVFGAPIDNANQARSHGQALLGRFQPDGTVLYQPSPNGLDYGRTHWARHANGLTASVLAGLLEAASFSGDRALWQEGLRLLQALDQYRHTVPRGAQTWEIPLHTPDILAAGYLVRAYTLGYEFTGDRRWLEQARYWAWTGVPFLYLHPPTSRPVGLYNTIPVLGATAWVAPCWIGLPVQWCGLVYGEALYGLAVHDPAGPWRQLADGIAVGGVQHTWPETDVERQGLLPDSYQLRPQLRDGPAINPATVQAPALRYYRAAKAYDSRAFRAHGLWVHAPGPIHEVTERADGVTFRVSPWSPQPSWVLVNGFRQVPRVRLNGLDTPLAAPHRFQLTEGRLALRLTESTRIELWYPTVAALRIVPSAEAGGVDLVWPASLTNAVVEHAFELSATSVWAVANALVYPQGGWWVTRRDLSTSQQFFRLRFEAYP